MRPGPWWPPTWGCVRRSGFKAKGWAPRPVKTIDYQPRPRAPAVAVAQPAGPVRPVPKFVYVRDERLRDMCRALACQHCGRSGDDAGVTWAHSNQSIHGKGGSVKASDQFVAAMCWDCHRELDQGGAWSQEEKVRIWNEAHRRTVAQALALGLWPADVPVPIDVSASAEGSRSAR